MGCIADSPAPVDTYKPGPAFSEDMHVLGIATGPEIDADAVIEAIAARLEERGSVGVVKDRSAGGNAAGGPGSSRAKSPEGGHAGSAGADRTVYEIGPGTWTAAGSDLDPTDALSRLATQVDYGLLVDVPAYRIPQVAIGEVDVDEPVLSATNVEDLGLEAVLEVIEEGEPFETLETLVERVKASPQAEYAGAIATFTGRVRAKEDPEDEFTESLTFERYEGVAEDRMGEIEAELESREGVLQVAMHHRTGRIEYGEDIVFVVVLAAHRREAFRTVEDGIDRLKAEVPIFKKEVTVEDEFWVHERA